MVQQEFEQTLIISAPEFNNRKFENFKNRGKFSNFSDVSFLTGLQEYVRRVMYWLFAMH